MEMEENFQFIALKEKGCLTFTEFGILEDRNRIEVFQDEDRILERKQCCDFLEGETIIGIFPLSLNWKFVESYWDWFKS